MKNLLPILLAVAAGAGVVYVWKSRAAPKTSTNPVNDAFGALTGFIKTGGGFLSDIWGGGSKTGNPGGATNRTAGSFDTAFIDLDDSEPTTMTVSPGLYTRGA